MWTVLTSIEDEIIMLNLDNFQEIKISTKWNFIRFCSAVTQHVVVIPEEADLKECPETFDGVRYITMTKEHYHGLAAELISGDYFDEEEEQL